MSHLEMRRPWFSKKVEVLLRTPTTSPMAMCLPCLVLSCFTVAPAILEGNSLPGWWQLLQVFNSRVVQYRHFVKQSWYTKFQPKSNQFGVDMLDDAKILRISKTLGRIFQRSNYESSPTKNLEFFLMKKIWGAFIIHPLAQPPQKTCFKQFFPRRIPIPGSIMSIPPGVAGWQSCVV